MANTRSGLTSEHAFASLGTERVFAVSHPRRSVHRDDADTTTEPRGGATMSVTTNTTTPTRSTPTAGRAPGPATYWRRRLVAVGVLLAAAFLLTALIGRVGAEAELEDKVAGHVVVQPGETLWDVAAETAPDGVDTREQLRAVAELNGLEGDAVDAWTVVLIPAR
jgi:hypothetical protein